MNLNRNLILMLILACWQAVAAVTNLVVFRPNSATTNLVPTVQASNIITGGTVDGDLLPAMSATKRGGVPATGTPAGYFLRDDGTWQARNSASADYSTVLSQTFTSGYSPMSAPLGGVTITHDATNGEVDLSRSNWGGAWFGTFSVTPDYAAGWYTAAINVTAISGTWRLYDRYGGNIVGYFSTTGEHRFTWYFSGSEGSAGYRLPLLESGSTLTLTSAYIYRRNDESPLELPRLTSMRRINIGQNVTGVSDYYTPQIVIGDQAKGGTTDLGTEGYQTVIGGGADATSFTDGTAGYQCAEELSGRMAIGHQARAGSWRATAIGPRAAALCVSGTALGWYTWSGVDHAVVIGRGAAITAQVPIPGGVIPGTINVSDLWLNQGWAHKIPHPRDSSQTSIANDLVPSSNPVTLHGIDAYDARAGGETSADSTVPNTTARDAIATASRWYGMDVYVTDLNQTHRLDVDWGGDLSLNTSWVNLGTGDRRGLNVAGGDLRLASGAGTGSGASGKVNLQTAPIASAGANKKNTLFTAAQVDATTTTNSGVWIATRFLVLDLQNNTLMRVYVNPTNDSAGVGMRTLAVGNN